MQTPKEKGSPNDGDYFIQNMNESQHPTTANCWKETSYSSLGSHSKVQMKYWVALLGDRQERLWFVTEKEENEFGLTKILRKEKYSSECSERWVSSGQVLNVDKVWINPVDNSTKENYHCNLIDLEPFKDRADIERFAMNHFRATIVWIEVSKDNARHQQDAKWLAEWLFERLFKRFVGWVRESDVGR